MINKQQLPENNPQIILLADYSSKTSVWTCSQNLNPKQTWASFSSTKITVTIWGLFFYTTDFWFSIIHPIIHQFTANLHKIRGMFPLGAILFSVKGQVEKQYVRKGLNHGPTPPKQNILRAGFEPATYGYLTIHNYSPPLYQLSYRRHCVHCDIKSKPDCNWLTLTLRTKCHLIWTCYDDTPWHFSSTLNTWGRSSDGRALA